MVLIFSYFHVTKAMRVGANFSFHVQMMQMILTLIILWTLSKKFIVDSVSYSNLSWEESVKLQFCSYCQRQRVHNLLIVVVSYYL